MRYEILENNIVVNTIEADEAFMTAQFEAGTYRLAEVQEVVPPVVGIPELKRITRLAFLNRFTDAEAIAIDLASIGSTVEAAAMRRYMSKVNAAEFIDLGSQETRDGVLALEAATLLDVGRASIILDAPILEKEKFK